MRFWTGVGMTAKSRMFPRALSLGYAELIDRAKLAEDLGFEAVVASEHHFMYDGFCPSPLLSLAGIAAGTSRIKLMTGAYLLPLSDPLRVAEEAALLDALSGGRVMLGFGMGYCDFEYAAFGVDKKTRAARFVEMMKIVGTASASERLTFRGRFYSYRGVRVGPRFVQRPIPTWLCGGPTVAAARRAGRNGFPYFMANTTFARAREFIELYRKTGREAGWPESQLRVAVFKDFCIASSVSGAKELREQLMRNFYEEHILGFGYLVDEQGRHLYNPSWDHPVCQEFLESIFCGTPEMIVEEIRRYETLGIEAMFPATEQVDLFVKEAMPHFQDAGSALRPGVHPPDVASLGAR